MRKAEARPGFDISPMSRKPANIPIYHHLTRRRIGRVPGFSGGLATGGEFGESIAMVASRVLLLAWCALASAPSGEAKDRPLAGEVVDADGRAAGGATVLVTIEGWLGDGPEVIGRATADAGGRFLVSVPGDLAGCDRATLWAIRDGSAATSVAIHPGEHADEAIRLRVGRGGLATFVVAGPDGRPMAGARVVPRRVARAGSDLPEALARLASATTDAEGRAVLSAFRPDEVVAVRVEAAGFGVQAREFAQADGMAPLGPKAFRLAGVGRVEGRVVGVDPKAVEGRTIRLVSTSEGHEIGLAEARTDGEGRFAVPAIAAGLVTIRIRPEAGSPELGIRAGRYALASGGRVVAEIPMGRGVRVTGIVRDAGDSRGVAGAVVAVLSPRSAEPRIARTDARGRYEAFVPPGPTSHRVLRVPDPYLCPPDFLGPRPLAVPPAIVGFELPAIELERGDQVRGRVVDADGQAMAGARVEATWMSVTGRTRVPRSAEATTRADGSFAVGPVAPEVDLTLVATCGTCDGDATRSPSIVARSSDVAPVVLTIPQADAVAPSGRVVDADGRAVAGARVRIAVLHRSPSGSVDGVSIAHFEGLDELRTDAEGRYRGPRMLRRDREYRAQGVADGHLAGRTHYRKPAGSERVEFPDLVLVKDAARLAIEGRILDRQGRPIAGAEVRTWAPGTGPARTATSGPDGRFRLEGVADEDGFVFAGHAGFRFVGRAVDPDFGPIDLTLARRGESPDAPMTGRLLGPDVIRARAVLAPYVDAVLARGDDATRVRVLEQLAQVDPARALRLVEGRAVADAWFADQLRASSALALLESRADGPAFSAIEAIGDPQARVAATLEAVDAVPRLAEATRAELLDRAIRDARSILDPADRVTALGLVAEELADSGEVEQARGLLEGSRPEALALSCSTSGGRARASLARALARFAPTQALELTEDLVDPVAFDQARIAVAVALAARDPEASGRALASLRDPKSIGLHLPEVAQALARSDPARARALLAQGSADEPCLPPYALGMMALAVARTDRPSATAWIFEAFDRLEAVARAEGHGPLGQEPARPRDRRGLAPAGGRGDRPDARARAVLAGPGPPRPEPRSPPRGRGGPGHPPRPVRSDRSP